MRAVAKKMPHNNKKKADRNCSGANGSLAFFSSFLGLQVPVNQNRRRRSRSPVKKQNSSWNSWNMARKKGHTILTVIHDFPVKIMEMFGIARKGCSIACHGSPSTNGKQFALFVLSYQIFQNSGIVNKCIQLSARNSQQKQSRQKVTLGENGSPAVFLG